MALTDSERTYWRQQADAGVKPDAIAAAIKAQRGSDSAPSGEAPKQEQAAPSGEGDKVSTSGLSGLVRGDKSPTVGLGESIVRGASRVGGLGFGPAIESFINSRLPKSLGGSGAGYDDTLRATQARNQAAQQQHPLASQLSEGTAAGLASLLPVGAAGSAVGAGARIASGAAAGALQGGVQAAGDYTSDPDRGGAADAMSRIAGGATAGGAVGAALPALGAGVSRVARAVTDAPERVGSRILTNISRGEAGGAAKGKAVGNMLQKAGPEGRELLKVVEEAGLTPSLATKAAAKPAAALKDVEKVLEHNERTALSPVYDAIDKAGTGPSSKELEADLRRHAGELRAAGNADRAEAIERHADFVKRNYPDESPLVTPAGKPVAPEQIAAAEHLEAQAASMRRELEGMPTSSVARKKLTDQIAETERQVTAQRRKATAAIVADRAARKETKPLAGSMLRTLRGSIGDSAFNNLADENTPFGQQVKREIYGVYSRALEKAAERTPGVKLAELKAGNQRASQLLGVSEVLADRAAKATAGGSTLSNAIMHGGFHAGLAGALGHAIWKGNPGEIAAILAAEGGLQFVKRVPQMLRHVDLATSRAGRLKAAAELGQELVRRIGNRAAPAAIAAGAARSSPDTSTDDQEAGDE